MGNPKGCVSGASGSPSVDEKSVCSAYALTRTALENAASAAGLLLTPEAMVASKPEKKAAGGHDHDHGGGFGDEMDF